ncbi:hypothetical protein TI39_contig457g00017 [Zymoseptoria brevis]|uniref:Pentatricopeptide repeat domain-containing protein n=1 Tax=Zymoseptoria brevis TaxID=1047168 RepID=A0A0F4GNP8_9PEZI|nr:hypothetical protein TI39_contig457g00017 [Zymoseptoria brevis]
MQTLWTRVAQVRGSCHCPQCVSSAHAVSRRAAGTAIRRAPRFWTTSTVWYSGIFAVAATLDLGIKQQRREQWNQAIAEVKQELGQVDDADKEFQEAMDKDIVANQEMRENFDSTAFRQAMPEWPVSTGQERYDGNLPPQSIYASDERKRKAMLLRWVPRKLERVQLSIDTLQLEFFAELHRRGWHEAAAKAVPNSYSEVMLQPSGMIDIALQKKHTDLYRIMKMKGQYSLRDGEAMNGESADLEFQTWNRSEKDVPLCKYRQDDEGEFHRTTYDLNRCLEELFNCGRRRELSQPAVLAKIYHNLHLSSAPPNVDTFNTMIVGLSDIGTKRLVEDCINAFRCTQIRTNEVSLAAILNYYSVTDNAEQFHHWLLLMRGQFGGLHTATPHINITPVSQGRLRRENGRVIQLPSPTPMVFNALVRGVIKFSGFEAAVKICAAMKEEGWGLSMSGLQPLLKDCSERKDWAAGLRVWTAILALKAKATRQKDERGWKTQVVDLPTFASMLNLCSRCGQRTAFEEVMQQAIRAHPKYLTQLVQHLKDDRAAEDPSQARRFAAARASKTASRHHHKHRFHYFKPFAEQAVIPRRYDDPEYDPFGAPPEQDPTKFTPLADGKAADEEKVVRVGKPVFWDEGDLSSAHSIKITPQVNKIVDAKGFAPSEGQLRGILPLTVELEDYENRERPMTIAR